MKLELNDHLTPQENALRHRLALLCIHELRRRVARYSLPEEMAQEELRNLLELLPPLLREHAVARLELQKPLVAQARNERCGNCFVAVPRGRSRRRNSLYAMVRCGHCGTLIYEAPESPRNRSLN